MKSPSSEPIVGRFNSYFTITIPLTIVAIIGNRLCWRIV